MMPKTIFGKAALLGGLLVLLFGFGAFITLRHASAQTAPQFLITWKTTGSYTPSFYQGKALPTYGSNITASLELVSQGKLIDLSQQNIYWYTNDVLVGGGTGTQQVTFPPLGEAPNSMTLRVTLPNYSSGYLIHEVQIPMVEPVAVLYAPYPNGQFSGNPLTIEAIPYFFNVPSASNLTYSWSVNDQSGPSAENPESAVITLPQGAQSGTALDVSLSITNPNDSTVGTASGNFTYESHL